MQVRKTGVKNRDSCNELKLWKALTLLNVLQLKSKINYVAGGEY